MATALKDAQDTVARLNPLLPELHTGIQNTSSSADLAKLAVQGFHADALKPLRLEIDPKTNESLGWELDRAFNPKREGSLKDNFEKTMQQSGDAIARWRPKAVGEFDQVTQSVQRLIDKLHEMATLMPEGQGSVPARAGGGPVRAGQMYMVGERGPELFMSASNGYIHPSGSFPYTPPGGGSGYGAGGGGVNITVNLNVPSTGLVLPVDEASYEPAARAIRQVVIRDAGLRGLSTS
jgi:hypothetical protein